MTDTKGRWVTPWPGGRWTWLKNVGKIASLCAILTTAFMTGRFLDNRYAKAGEMQLVSYRLDQKILQDRIDWLTNKINELLDKYGREDLMSPEVRAWFRDLLRQLEIAKEQLRNLH